MATIEEPTRHPDLEDNGKPTHGVTNGIEVETNSKEFPQAQRRSNALRGSLPSTLPGSIPHSPTSNVYVGDNKICCESDQQTPIVQRSPRVSALRESFEQVSRENLERSGLGGKKHSWKPLRKASFEPSTPTGGSKTQTSLVIPHSAPTGRRVYSLAGSRPPRVSSQSSLVTYEKTIPDLGGSFSSLGHDRNERHGGRPTPPTTPNSSLQDSSCHSLTSTGGKGVSWRASLRAKMPDRAPLVDPTPPQSRETSVSPKPPTITTRAGQGEAHNGEKHVQSLKGSGLPPPCSPANYWRERSKHIDPTNLPPAFQVRSRVLPCKTSPVGSASPSSARTSPQRQADVVSPSQKVAVLSPAKLKRKWPPVQSSAKVAVVSVFRAEGVTACESVKTRRHKYEQKSSVVEGCNAIDTEACESPSQSDESQYHDSTMSGVDNKTNPSTVETAKGAVDTILEDPSSRWETNAGQTAPKPKRRMRASMKIRWGDDTYFIIDARSARRDEKYPVEAPTGLPYAPLLHDRFGATTPDGASPLVPNRIRDASAAPLSRPRRSYDDWSDDESDSSEDDSGDATTTTGDMVSAKPNKSLKQGERGRPEVWVTPLGDDEQEDSKLQWRVKRVFHVDSVDEHDDEQIVNDKDLLDTVKILLAVPESRALLESGWKFKKIYDVDGEILGCSRTITSGQNGLLQGFADVAKECQEPHQDSGDNADAPVPIGNEGLDENEGTAAEDSVGAKPQGDAAGAVVESSEMTDVPPIEPLVSEETQSEGIHGPTESPHLEPTTATHELQVKTHSLSRTAEGETETQKDGLSDAAGDSYLMNETDCDQQERISSVSELKPHSGKSSKKGKEKKKKKKKKKELEGEPSIFDLLSPPSVTTFHGYE